MAVKPTLSDALVALKIATGRMPFDPKYDVNGDGVIDTSDYIGLQKAYLGKDPGFAFVGDTFESPSTKTAADYAAQELANQQRLAAEQQENQRRQTLLSDAQKIYGRVTADLVANNPNLTAQQLASLATRNYWANESEAFARVSEGMKNGTAQLKQVVTGYDEGNNPITQLAITTGEHPGYDTLYLTPTSQKGVYSFSTPNQVAGGMISGVIGANPETGQYQPIQDYTTQVQYTPGASGGFAGNLIGSIGDALKSMGPIPMIVGNAILPGAGSALGAALALDEGNTKGALLSALASGGAMGADAAKNALAAEVSGNVDLANQYSSGIQGTLAENLPSIKTATSAAQLANSLDQGNVAGALNAVGNLTGATNPTINTGIAIAALGKSLSTGDFAQAAAISGQLTNDPDLQVASQAYKTLNALSTGNIPQAFSSGVTLSKIADSYLQPTDAVSQVEAPTTSLADLLPSQIGDYFSQNEPVLNVADTTPIFAPYQPPEEPAYQPPAYEPPAYEPPVYQPSTYEPSAYQPPAYEPPADNSANANFVNSYIENDPTSSADYLPENQQDTSQNTQPQNLDFANSFDNQSQAPETQAVSDAVVSQADLQDNQPTMAQGTSMADILDSLGGFDTVDTSGDNIDAGGGWNPAGDYSNIIPDGGVDENGNPTYVDSSGNPVDLSGAAIPPMPPVNITGTGGTKLSSLLKGLMPTTTLGKAALATGAGGVLQGLIGANASLKAAQMQSDAAKAALAQQQGMFNTLNAQQAPYRSAGYGALNQIQSMLPGQYTQYDAQGNPMGTAAGSGYLTQQFTPELFQQGIDPGYAFRLQQGQMATQRQGNVAGGGLGGNVQKGLQDYTQGLASQEYGNAFNRYQTQRSNIYNTLAGIAGIGQTGQGQANQLGTNLANAQTNLGVGSAAAQAAGQVGQAGAYGGALGSINQALLLSQLPDIAAAMKGNA